MTSYQLHAFQRLRGYLQLPRSHLFRHSAHLRACNTRAKYSCGQSATRSTSQINFPQISSNHSALCVARVSTWKQSGIRGMLYASRVSKSGYGTEVTGQISTNANSVPLPRHPLKEGVVRHESIYNVPNFLTLSRLLMTPWIGYLIIEGDHLYAFSLFTVAALSDLMDGWIARRWGLQTVVGSVVDPMADKFLMTTLVTCLAINGSLAAPLAALILGRDVSLAVSALYYRYASLPAPKTAARYWDFSLPSAEVHPTAVSKFNTFLQLSLLGTLLCTNLLQDPSATSSAAGDLLGSVQGILGGENGVATLISSISAIVATTTIYSGLEYTWSRKAVVILGGDDDIKKKQGVRGRMIMAAGFGSSILLAGLLWSKKQEDKEHMSSR